MGGGGFSMEPDNPLLDEYFVAQCGEDRPRVCFVPTATGDADGYIVKFHTAFNKLPCTPTHLSLFRPPKDIEGFILSQDALYVGGGNTKNMLALWKEWGLDHILRKAWQAGTVLGGISAGSICWFEQGLSDSIPGTLSVLPCLGFLKGSNAVHYHSDALECATYLRMVAAGELLPGLAADDGVALHFTDDRLVRAVSSRPNAHTYRVTRVGDEAVEEEITTEYLGAG